MAMAVKGIIWAPASIANAGVVDRASSSSSSSSVARSSAFVGKPLQCMSPVRLKPPRVCKMGKVEAASKRAVAVTALSQEDDGSTNVFEKIAGRKTGKQDFDLHEFGLWCTRCIGLTDPYVVAKWSIAGVLVLTIVYLLCKATILNAEFWMYASWVLVIWPWPAAIIIGVATLVTALQSRKRQLKEWEQVAVLCGSLIWLILVPLAHFQGYVDGWPVILFGLYLAFFLINAWIRYQIEGDLWAGSGEKQWDITPSRSWQIGFLASIVSGHWFAAYEAASLQSSWNFNLTSTVAAAFLFIAFLSHYRATYYLVKYFDRLVKPRDVVIFGPYRWVRHPIYASYILLLAGYCLALRSYKSLGLLVATCFFYYEQRIALEEQQLVDTFGESYTSYRDRVPRKYFPLLF